METKTPSSHVQTREFGISKNKQKTKYSKDAYQSLWTVMQVNNNRTVNVKKGLSATQSILEIYILMSP